MSNQSYGQVVSFSLSVSQLRKSAALWRKRGHLVEALELQRRAAWKGNMTRDWMTLADMLCELGCWEQASDLLLRVLSREDAPLSAWWELGCCFRTLNNQEMAEECLCHYLAEDLYAPMADYARMYLEEMETPKETREPKRLDGMIQRGLGAWQRGDQELGQRRLRRAVRLSDEPMRLHMTMMMMHMAYDDLTSAMKEAARALQCAPNHPRALNAMAMLLQQMGRPRAARAFLRKSIPLCQSVNEEKTLLSTAMSMNANREIQTFLTQALKRHPNRITLLHAQAWTHWESGRRDQALRIWKHILRLDAEDCRAQTLLRFAPASTQDMMPMEAMLPQETLRVYQDVLRKAAGEVAPEELVRHGSPYRAMLDWCIAMEKGEEPPTLRLLLQSRHPDVIGYLKELLMLPDTSRATRKYVVMRLKELEYEGRVPILLGASITTMGYRNAQEKQAHPSLWHAFLPRLLYETRRWNCSPELTAFAADLWAHLSLHQRMAAASPMGYAYVKAIEWLYLRLSGHCQQAHSALEAMPVSMRRIRRVVRELLGVIRRSPALSEIMNTEDVDDELHQF